MDMKTHNSLKLLGGSCCCQPIQMLEITHLGEQNDMDYNFVVDLSLCFIWRFNSNVRFPDWL